jgi:uncharacterized membrane protein YdjX (TVP38/TMEM64 family)
LISIIVLLFIVFPVWIGQFFSDIQGVRELILSFGVISPIIFILLHITQVLIAPIPGQIFGFIGGYLFGVWLGTLYSIIGTVLGTLIAVILVRKLGQPFARKIVARKTYGKFDKFCKKEGILTLFFIYLLPFFPDDAISFIAGLSNIKLRYIILVAFLGRLPGMFGLSLIGAGVAEAEANVAAVIMGILIAISFIIYLYKDKLQNKMIKLIKKLTCKKNQK